MNECEPAPDAPRQVDPSAAAVRPGPARGWIVLLRASASSVVATVVDGLAYQLILLGASGHYSLAAFVGALLGAVTNFSLNRSWAFPPSRRSLAAQVALYALSSLLVYLALQLCLILLVEKLGVDERLAWVPAKVVTWLAVSYPLFRYLVFPSRQTPHAPEQPT